MTMTTLPTRCSTHYLTTARDGQGHDECIRDLLRYLAAELNHAGHQDAAGWLLSQLNAEVIPLRPRTPGDAA
jgi:hypothetical protein